MNELRLILLIAGVLLVIGIYFWGRRSRPSVAEQPPPTIGGRAEGVIPQLDDAVLVRARVAAVPPTIRAESLLDTAHLPVITTDFPGGEPVADKMPYSSLEAPRRQTPTFDAAPHDVPSEPPQSRVANKNVEPTSVPKSASNRKIVALRLAAGDTRVEGAKLKSWFEEAGLRHGKFDIFHRMHDERTQLFSVASMVEPGTFDPFAMAGVQFPGVTLFLQLPGPIDGVEMVSQMLACGRDLERKMGGILQDDRGQPLTDARAQRLRDEAADFLHLSGQL